MDDHDFERAYWGDCCNTFDEEQKHFVYAAKMGLEITGYAIDAGGKAVLDIGGGPVSMLLKTKNLNGGMVLDPLMEDYPSWVHERYQCRDISPRCASGERPFETPDPRMNKFDEVWIYNVLQHTEDPAKIIANAKTLAPVLRIFEWIDIPPHEGHPHMLTASLLDTWISPWIETTRSVGALAERGCYGRFYAGCFEFRRESGA